LLGEKMKLDFFVRIWAFLLISSLNSIEASQVNSKFLLSSPLDRQIFFKTSKLKATPLKGESIATQKKSEEIVVQPSKTPSYTILFPIYPKELAKFFGLSSMMFWAIFVFTLARDTKDALIVTSCGAESIAFLKVYGVIPAATLFMILYSKLASILSPSVSLASLHSPLIFANDFIVPLLRHTRSVLCFLPLLFLLSLSLPNNHPSSKSDPTPHRWAFLSGEHSSPLVFCNLLHHG
jgi:hypothetical protein